MASQYEGPRDFYTGLSHDLDYVTPEVAAIRRFLDANDLAGHAHRAPLYYVVEQESLNTSGANEVKASTGQQQKLGEGTVSRLVAY
jgi:hypothetical protein